MKTTVSNIERIVVLAIQGWDSTCPDKPISGLTLQQFRDAVKPTLECRAQLTTLEVEWQKALTARRVADRNSMTILQRVVHAIKGDPDLGEDSAFYATLGYVRKSDRSSGLTRKREKEAAKAGS